MNIRINKDINSTELRNILEEIKIINNIYYLGYDQTDLPWDGTISFNGIKRLIYGIWHDARNEDGTLLSFYMCDDSKELYLNLIEKYKVYNELSIKIA